jgi:hypothetical protein
MNINEDKVENTPAGGALIGKRKGQTMIHNKGSMSGYLVGKTHAEGGIKAINKSTGQPLEMQGGEVVITAPAVSDQTKHKFDGKMMTNREILSTINERGGGVAFAKDGMEIPKRIKRTGASYNYGGRTMTDHEIYKYITGGGIAEEFSIRDIADIHQMPLAELKEEVRIGMLAESEHKGNAKDQMEIVKDHLLENPKYYTLLKKAGLVEEKKSLKEKSKWLQSFYITNNPSIDKLLIDLQPKIEELIEKQKELVIKTTTEAFGKPMPMTESDIQLYEAGLIFKMVQSFNKFIKNTDELYDVSVNKRGGLFEVNSKVKRDGRTYRFDTELIGAGGYNIQEYHYRYIIKTDLPSSNENSAVENIKAKMGVLKKIRTIDEDIARYTNRVKKDEEELKQGFRFYKISDVEYKKDLSDFDIKSNQRDIKEFTNDIKKLEGKKADLISVFQSLDKKRVGVNFGKQVKEAIGSRILVDRLRGSKYKETGDTLDFKIENRIIKGKDLGDRRIEILGNINSFSFVDEGNGLCTMKAGLELRGKYTPYAEYKNLPLKEIPYKINEIFNGEFERYLQYEDGGETTKVVTYRDKYNKKYNYPKNTSHTLNEISKDTNVSMRGLQQIYNKGIGAYKTNPSSVRPNVKSKEQWAMARVYSAVMGGKASKVDSNELKMSLGGGLHKDDLEKDSKSGNTPARDLNNYNDLMDVGVDSEVGGANGLSFENGGSVIRQLGNGSNVYFETHKHRLNDNSYGDKGKYILNIGAKEGEYPKESLYFNDLKEALSITEKIERDFPNGVPEAILLDKVIENYKKESTAYKKEYEYVLTQRPFGIGTYPTKDFLRFEDRDFNYGVLVYSQPVPLNEIEHYSLSPITELKEYDDKILDYKIGKLNLKARVKLILDNRKGYFVNLFISDDNGILKTQPMSGVKFLEEIKNGKLVLETKVQDEPKKDDVGSKKQKSFESEGSTEGKGKLYEFFTPQVVADKMLALAQHYGFKGGNVLEPATGSGRLIKNLKDTNITAFEISKDNFEILKREFPNAELYNYNFEKAFLKEPRFNTLLNRKGTETWLKGAPFDLVLANPPYGKFSGMYSSYFNFKGQVEHFFILQTLYLLKKGGLGVYLIPSSFLRNGVSYNNIKKQIFEIAEFVDAYRLPSNIFEKTQIGTDILILRKK